MTSSGAPRAAAYLATGSAYLLIVVGGLVRATGSGLGCPDWPLCYGQPLPPALQAPIIEFSHRMLASITTLLAVAASALILRAQSSPILRVLAIVVPLLLLVIIGLGAAVVILELPPNLVTVHLGLAFLLLGMLTSEAVLLTPRHETIGPAQRAEIGRLAMLASAIVYGQALLGGLVRGSGASLACTGFPLCNGEVVPTTLGGLVGLHLLHRAGAVIVVGLLIYVVARAHRVSPDTSIATLSKAVLMLALLQGAIGIYAVTALLPPVSQVLHVAGAAAVWATTVALAVSAASPGFPSMFAEAGNRRQNPQLARAR